MDNDLDRRVVRGAPELMAELNSRRDDDPQELTEYAVAHGVDLPEGYTPEWEIVLLFDNDGNDLGLYWFDPDRVQQAI